MWSSVARHTTGYTYNANGSLETVTQPNAVVHTYGYDALNRLRGLVVSRSTTLIHTYEYKLNPTGHRHQVVENSAKTTTYDYDDLYRLTGETVVGDSHANNGEIGYMLDKVGNRQSRTSQLAALNSQLGLTYNARDWLAGDTYTANGSTQASSQLSALNPQLAGTDTYDFEEHLILRTKTDGATINVSYDADGHRIQKILLDASAQPVSTTNWLVDTNNLTGYAQVVEERTISGGASPTSLVRTYTYGASLISQATSLNAAPATLSYFTHDGHGNVRELTDVTGSLNDRYDYDAFGSLVYRSGTTPNAYLYCGEQRDEDLGLYYLRARYLNPDNGRFWSKDGYEGTSQDPGSLHKYLYANCDPVDLIDPSGNMTLGEAGNTAGITGRLATMARVTVRVVRGKLKNLVCAGAKSGGQIHHIASNKTGAAAEAFEQLFKKVGLTKADLDSWINKIMLPMHPTAFKGGGGGHPPAYHQLVYNHLVEMIGSHAAKGLDPALAVANGLLDLADALCDPKSTLTNALLNLI